MNKSTFSDSVNEDREDLREFLEEAELSQYHELFRDILKVTKVSQLKFVVTEDLAHIGLSKPEQRRYKKVYTKYFPNPYISKIKKLLTASKKHDLHGIGPSSLPVDFQAFSENNAKIPTKHIISVEDITINKELGMGQFGVVQQGIWNTGYQRLQVAIKCLGHERMTSNSTEFLKEAAVMHSIEHPNIVRLYGVVFHLDSLMLVTELAPLRSLLECLREVSLRPNFPVPTLCEFAEQICDGMTYLENKRLIHRDLAARNILVFNKDCVKISDFGLSRALGVGKDYYQTNYNVNLKLPVAWCAPECILYLKFTSASDVWAFGVCLWEMFTFGFQPWAAFSGQQILEAIDAPNYQRLEKPDCCPETYFALMNECWSHDPNDRPKFKDLTLKLRAIRPEQVQASSNYQRSEEGRRSNFLEYKSGQIITVLGKETMTKSSLWYGVLPGGACGVFDPNATKPYVKNNRSSIISHQECPPLSGRTTTSPRSCLLRTDVKRHTYTGKRTIQLNMISSPQGEVKHTGHVGLDGAYFGDISFLDPAGCPPRQVVTPYKPSEDLEQVPLINPNSPSHLSCNASSTPPYPLLSQDANRRPPNLPREELTMPYDNKGKGNSKKPVLKPLAVPTSSKSIMNRVKSATLGRSFKSNDASKTDGVHEYHEISDTDTESNAEHAKVDNLVTPDSPGIGKNFSQSLLEEMETMFRSLHSSDQQREDATQRAFDLDNVARAHSLSKLERRKAHHSGTMKQMSAHDVKTLDTAVALANEITNRTMNDLDSEYGKAPHSPSEKSKFHFKLPLASSFQHQDQDVEVKEANTKQDRRNFSEEARSVPDIQATLTEESKMAYSSLIEQPSQSSSLISQIAQEASDMHKPSTIPKSRLKLADANFNSLRKLHARSSVTVQPIKPGITNAAPRDDAKDESSNELPLPPRSSKPKMVEKTRHVRKYPLVLQDEPLILPSSSKSSGESTNGASNIYQNLFNRRIEISCHVEASRVAALRRSDQKAQYQNLDLNSVDVFDGATPEASGKEIPTTNPFKNGTSCVNPFECFLEGAAAASEGSVNAEEASKKEDFEGSLLKDCTDHVSVEDLLEFAHQKPCGRQRGTESDEVRIMCKVLKDQVIPGECLEALELCDWNVHYAIKIMRVRCATGNAAELTTCAQALHVAAGDVVKASADIVLAKQN